MKVQKLIDKHLLKEQEDRKDRVRSGKFSPSSFGRCFRLQYWNRMNESPTNPPNIRSLRVFKVGYLFHEFVQGFIPDKDTEVKIETDDIIGFADIVTEDTVIDIKSQHSRGFWYMNKDTFDINVDKYANILQVMTYAYLLKKPKGQLVFISKDDLCMNEYVFYLEKWQPEVEKELSTLREYWDKGELPPAEPRAYKGKEGKYCQFQDKCLSLGWDCVKGKEVT